MENFNVILELHLNYENITSYDSNNIAWFFHESSTLAIQKFQLKFL